MMHFDDSGINHEESISGDTIELTVKGPWDESEMTLKRAKERGTSLECVCCGRQALLA
jgi:hypothetical protein